MRSALNARHGTKKLNSSRNRAGQTMDKVSRKIRTRKSLLTPQGWSDDDRAYEEELYGY